jgi:hypothetical protein
MTQLPPIFCHWPIQAVYWCDVLTTPSINWLECWECSDEMSWIRIARNSIIISCPFALGLCCLGPADAFAAVGIALGITGFFIPLYYKFMA